MNHEQYVITALSANHFLMVNKNMLKHLNGDSTAVIILTELILKHQFYKHNHQLDSDGYFFCTLKTLEDSLGIKRGAQDHALKHLIDKELIYIINKGFPKKRYFEIQYSKLYEVLDAENIRTEKTRDEFFSALNGSKTFTEWVKNKQNIQLHVAKAMWILKIKTRIIYTSRDFGMLKYYLFARFKGKAWDYSTFNSATFKPGMNIASIIDQLRCLETDTNLEHIQKKNLEMDVLYFNEEEINV